MENEFISHDYKIKKTFSFHIFTNYSLFAIFLPKIIKIGGNLTKFWQKQICTVFWDTVYNVVSRYSTIDTNLRGTPVPLLSKSATGTDSYLATATCISLLSATRRITRDRSFSARRSISLRYRQSINQSFICSEQHKKQVQCTIHCWTGHKQQVSETDNDDISC